MHVVFGAYELDVDRRELRRAGEVVPLEPKAFKVLVHLLTHRHRAVSKSELLETLWPEEYVTDAALTRSVRLIRQAVGDAGHQQHIIKTLRGYGYRFMAEVTLPPGEAMRGTASERLSGDVLDEHVSEGSLAVASPPQEAAQPEGESTPEACDALVPSSGDAAPLPDVPPKPSVSPAPVHQLADAERRPLTVLVCDLAQGAQLAEQLDPEDLRQVMRAYHTTCERVLTQYEGYRAQRLGSRLVVYFGYPQAQEDAAQRAVLTGLGLLEALSALNFEIAQQQAVTLSVQVGIDSGLVVVETGGDERAGPLAIGSPQSRAAQLQEAAAPQSVVISADTQHLVQGWFRCDELSPHIFQGLDTTVPIYQVIGRSGAQHRLEAAAPGGLTPLVGRENEVGLLSERWQRVCESQGQVVVLSGEAGIGKSRLVQVLKEEVISEPHVLWECRSSPYYQNTALHPITELLQRVVDGQSDDDPVTRLDKLEAFLSQSRLAVSDTVPLLAPLLSIPLPETCYPPLALSPQQQRQKTLESLVALVLEQAVHQPVLLILEDLRWTDPTTLELLDLLIDQAPTARLLMLLTSRPEFQSPWRHRSYLTQIMLNRLSRSQIALMAKRVAAGQTLPGEVLQQIVDKTDGIPLFVEEITKTVLESGMLKEVDGHYQLADTVSILSIPATLQDSLMARLDRLGMAKGVAQYASVIGRQFSYELLQAVSGLDETMLQHELERLVAAELVYQRGVIPQATYTFKHALIQDSAYQSLLRTTKQGYHQRLAEVLVEQFPHTVESQPALLALHYTEAGVYAQAIVYWLRAGEQAMQRSANLEAIRHLTRGIELLEELPVTAERTQQELMLYVALSTCLASTKGPAAPEAAQAYNRARELCQQTGNASPNLPVLFGLWRFYLTSAQLSTAKDLVSQLLRHTQRMQDPDVLVEVHLALGSSLFFLGDLTASQEQLAQGMSYYDSRQHRSHTFFYGQDPGVVQLSHLSVVLWLLGFPNRAQQNSDDALMLAREVSHPYSLVFALSYIASLHQLRREIEDIQGRTEEAISLATEHGFTQWVVHHMMLQDYCMAESSERENAINQLCWSLSAWQDTGALLALPYYLALLAEVYETANRPDEGLAAVHEALNIVDKTGERWFEAELYRLTGELLLKQSVPDVTQAEAAFQQALDIARSQQAKSWELRAAMSLSRLWQQQGKRRDAYDLLAPVYTWFTEGFDTADLIEAKSLLDELSIARGA